MVEEFKKFVKTKPSLIDYVKRGDTTWQSLYEIYDLYGENSDIWDKYSDRNIDIKKISNIVKNVDVDSIKSHINTAQKAIDFIGDLTKKNPTDIINKVPVTERPLNKFFED